MPTLTLDALATREALAAVITSADTGTVRPILNAVRLRVTRGPRVRFEACDNFRAAFAEVTGEVAKSGAVPESTVIALASAKALLNALPSKAPRYGASGAVTFAWARNGTLTARTGDVGLTLEVRDGEYPNTDAIQPKGKIVAEVTVDSKLLASVALAMGTLATKGQGGSGTITILVRKAKVNGGGLAHEVAYEIAPRGRGPLSHAILMPVAVKS